MTFVRKKCRRALSAHFSLKELEEGMGVRIVAEMLHADTPTTLFQWTVRLRMAKSDHATMVATIYRSMKLGIYELLCEPPNRHGPHTKRGKYKRVPPEVRLQRAKDDLFKRRSIERRKVRS